MEERFLDEELARAVARNRGLPASTEAGPEAEDEAGNLEPFLAGGAAPRGTGRWLAEGDRLGKYIIRQELGRGAFGVVYLAEDGLLPRAVALKVPRPDLVQSAALWDKLATDARLSATLSHQGIVRVYEAGVVEGMFLIASEYERAVNLADWLDRSPGGISPRLAAGLARQLAEALAHAHDRNIVHRDVKPANILVVEPGPGGDHPAAPRLKITDFGLGRLMESIPDSASATGHWQGTCPYMAPEQVIPGRGRIDSRADVYALGAVLYEMLTGYPIYQARTILDLYAIHGRGEPPVGPRRRRARVPADLETLTLACLDPDPGRRPTARKLAEELGRYLGGFPIETRPLGWPTRVYRYVLRRPTQAALIGVTAGAVAGLAGLAIGLARSNAGKAEANRAMGVAIRQLDATVARERRAVEDLLASQRAARRAVYEAALQRAAYDIRAGRVESAQELLSGLAPRPGEEDLREFAWRLQWARATHEHTVERFSGFGWWRPPPEIPESLPRERLSLKGFGPFTDIGAALIQHMEHGILTRFDGAYWRYVNSGTAEGRGPHTDALDGLHRASELPPRGLLLLSPDGETLVTADQHAIEPTSMPDEPAEGTVEMGPVLGGPRRAVRRLGLPQASWICYSADGGTLGALLEVRGSDRARVFPAFYDMRHAERGAGNAARVGHPGKQRPSWFGWKSSELPYPSHTFLGRLVLSPDGRLAAMTGWEPRVEVFETWTGRVLWSLEGDDIAPNTAGDVLAFSPDGRVLVTGGTSGHVRAWEAATGLKISERQLGTEANMALGFYPDARTVAVTSLGEDRIRFWRYEPKPDNPRERFHEGSPPERPFAEVWGVGFARGGELLLSCDDLHRLKAFDVAAGREARGLVLGPTGFMAMAVHPGGRLVGLVDYDGRYYVHDVEATAERIEKRGALGGRGRGIAWSPDGESLAVVGRGGEILVARGGEERRFQVPHAAILGVAWSPDGGTLALAGHDERSVTLWEAEGLTRRASIAVPGRPVCLAYSPDGGLLVVGDADGRLLIFDARRPEAPRFKIERASEAGGVWALAFSPDGRTLATGGDDMMVRLWDPSTGRELSRLEGHTAKVHAVAFDPRGATLASADFAGRILIWHAGPEADDPARALIRSN